MGGESKFLIVISKGRFGIKEDRKRKLRKSREGCGNRAILLFIHITLPII